MPIHTVYCATTALDGYPLHSNKNHYIQMVTSLYVCSTALYKSQKSSLPSSSSLPFIFLSSISRAWWLRQWRQRWMLERLGKRPKNPTRVFRHVYSETHTLSDQQVLGLRNKYSRVHQRYVDSITCYH